MRIASLTFLATAMLLAGSLIYLIAKSDDPAYCRRMREDSEALLLLVPNTGTRNRILARAREAGRDADRLTARIPIGRKLDVSSVVGASVTRLFLGLRAMPIICAAFAIGILAGLLRRERIRDEFVFASVTASYFSKLLVGLSVVAYLFTSLSPVGPPMWTLYLSAATGAAGATVYFGNLPPKI